MGKDKFAIGTEDGKMRLWSQHTWSIVTEARFHKKPVTGIAVFGDGKLMITAAGNKIIVWNAQTLKKAHEYKFEKELAI